MVVFGLALPVLLIGSASALEYATLVTRRAQLQKAADTAALSAAQELKISTADDGRIASVARTVALSTLKEGADPATTATVQGEVIEQRTGVEVRIDETVSGIFGKALSLPTTELHVRAIARLSGNATKICVLGLDKNDGGTIRLDSNAKLTANGCAIYSNSSNTKGVRSESNAVISSTQLICSSGGFAGGAGNFSGKRLADCPLTADPMAGRAPPPVEPGCRPKAKIESDQTLYPGTYCNGLFIGASAKVTLMPGIYTIKNKKLSIEASAEVYGRNVCFYFTGSDAAFEFTENAKVNLSAPKDGPMAGILFYGDPAAERERKYRITSNYANTLVGTIYIPQGEFIVDANHPVADQSAWTAIVVRKLQLFANPHLTLNSNYHQTDVPVPDGLIANGKVRLAQ